MSPLLSVWTAADEHLLVRHLLEEAAIKGSMFLLLRKKNIEHESGISPRQMFETTRSVFSLLTSARSPEKVLELESGPSFYQRGTAG